MPRTKQATIRRGTPAPVPEHLAAASARPFVKWAGGKRAILPQLAPLLPHPGRFTRYLEPFVGSGAVFFLAILPLGPREAILLDGNPDLIDTYRAIQTDVEAVIGALAAHARRHDPAHYYAVRAARPRTLVTRAARLIYLNKTCFNGLYRVNSRGQFNVPIGDRRNTGILDADNLRAVSRALRGVRVETADFRAIAGLAGPGDFVYLDPPYDPASETALFTSYTRHSFTREDQEDLAELYRLLDRRGCRLMLSNSDTPLVRSLYRGFALHPVAAPRMINARGDRRGPVPELAVLNYEPG